MENSLACTDAVSLAPTGCAAHNIKGYTWQNALSKSEATTKDTRYVLGQQTINKLAAKFNGIKLVVIDEVSMIDQSTLFEIHVRLLAPKLATTTDPVERECIKREERPFGGTHILFCGDFYQLKPVGGRL